MLTSTYYHDSERTTTVSESQTPTVFELRTIGSHRFVIRTAQHGGVELVDLTRGKTVRKISKSFKSDWAIQELKNVLSQAEEAHKRLGKNSPFVHKPIQVVAVSDFANAITLKVNDPQALEDKLNVFEYPMARVHYSDDIATLYVSNLFNAGDVAQYLGEVA